MAVKMYKDNLFKMVRGMDAQAHLDDGWAFDVPSKTTSTKPKAKYKLKVKDVDIKQTNLHSPEDSNIGD